MDDEKIADIENLTNLTDELVAGKMFDLIDQFREDCIDRDYHEKYILQSLHFLLVKIMMRCALVSKHIESEFSELLDPKFSTDHMYNNIKKEYEENKLVKKLVESFLKKI